MAKQFFALMLVVVVFFPVVGFAQNANDKLTQGIRAYNDLEWESAITLLNEALRLGLPETAQIQAYQYLGFCYIDTNQPAKAQQAFESLLKIDSDYELSTNLPPKYLDVFNNEKSKFKAAMPKPGSIFVKSDPSSAQVALDGVLQTDRTPTTIREVTAGSHSLKLTLSGYKDYEQQINVEGGKTAEVNAKLIEVLPPRPEARPVESVKKGSSLPWIILGGAIAAGGGVAAAVLLSKSKDGDGSTVDNTPKTASLTISLRFP